MKAEGSGKVYLFKLEHNLGYGFAEVYDFTDDSVFDGRFVYVYNRVDPTPQKSYTLSDIRPSGIALGPITLYKFPNVRGVGAWKLLFQTKDLLMDAIPATKTLRGILVKDDNWNNLKDWCQYPYNSNMPAFVPYSEVRQLETRILNSNTGVVTKFSMKQLIDAGKPVGDYYDLADLGTKNMYVQLINTYYSLEKVEVLLKQIPKAKVNVG